MTRKSIAGVFVAGLVLHGSAAVARQARTYIDVSVTAEGACLAKIGDETVALTRQDLEARLPVLVPRRNADLRLRGDEKLPDRCVGPLISSLQKLGYESIGFDVAPPPLDPDIKIPDADPR